MPEAYIVDACRTPRGIGKVGKGALSEIHPQQLGATVLKALAERTGINTGDVDLVYLAISTLQVPEVVGYPDSRKTGVAVVPWGQSPPRRVVPKSSSRAARAAQGWTFS